MGWLLFVDMTVAAPVVAALDGSVVVQPVDTGPVKYIGLGRSGSGLAGLRPRPAVAPGASWEWAGWCCGPGRRQLGQWVLYWCMLDQCVHNN